MESPSSLFNPVRYQPGNTLAVGRAQLGHFIKPPARPLGFGRAKVALGAARPHDFTAPGYLKAALGAFMRFQLWHSVVPLFRLSLRL